MNIINNITLRLPFDFLQYQFRQGVDSRDVRAKYFQTGWIVVLHVTEQQRVPSHLFVQFLLHLHRMMRQFEAFMNGIPMRRQEGYAVTYFSNSRFGHRAGVFNHTL